METTHHSPPYLRVFLALAVLTIIELAVSREEVVHRLPIALAPLLIALAIAKGLLIVLYYMHLKYDSRVFAAVFSLGLVLGLGFAAAVIIR